MTNKEKIKLIESAVLFPPDHNYLLIPNPSEDTFLLYVPTTTCIPLLWGSKYFDLAGSMKWEYQTHSIEEKNRVVIKAALKRLWDLRMANKKKKEETFWRRIDKIFLNNLKNNPFWTENKDGSFTAKK